MRKNIIYALNMLVLITLSVTFCFSQSQPLVLEGTIVTPDSVITRGWIVIQRGKIDAVLEQPPDIPHATTLKTKGIIFPGLIDLHNHVAWNAFPRWIPPRKYDNRYEWRQAPDYLAAVEGPGRKLQEKYFCQMNMYGELRALVGGVTSIQGSRAEPCIIGFVRNLDFHSGFYPGGQLGRESFVHMLDIKTLIEDHDKTEEIVRRIQNGKLHAFLIHLAEGKPGDQLSEDEFKQLDALGLLTENTAIIHGTALGDKEFRRMSEAGAGLVWSPRSNIELYGQTTNISSTLAHGIRVALAPDWAITGSSNMLDELRFVAQWNKLHLGGLLTEKQLVQMVTEIPAKIAGIDDKVGSIRVGLYADLLVIKGNRSQPYRALANARPKDVRLVLIGGEPIYGTTKLMKKMRKTSDFEEVVVCDAKMGVHLTSDDFLTSGARERFEDIQRSLREALATISSETGLAPIAECKDPQP